MKLRNSFMVLVGFMAACLLTANAQAQIVELPKLWTGTRTGTTFGAPSPLHPRHSANVGAVKETKGFDTFTDGDFKLEIKRQQGRHLEIAFGDSKHTLMAVGTLSADGKQMLFKTRFFTVPFIINGNSISGCGGSNGNDGTIEHWLNNYAALCFDLTAVK
jgi:hypothetical protein